VCYKIAIETFFKMADYVNFW